MRRIVLAITIVTLSLLWLAACGANEATQDPTPAPATVKIEEPTATIVAPTDPPAATVTPALAFEDQLIQALVQRDFAGLQGLMRESFMIAGWRSEGTAYAPDGAIGQLRSNFLAEAATLTFDRDRDLTALLDGMDPVSILGQGVNDPRALFVSGWGPEGHDEAILYIAHDAEGEPYWYGFLYSFGGFVPPAAEEVPETDVKFVIAQEDVTMYAAPDESADVIGGVFGGQTARVTGVSADGLWWRVICPDDTVGSCWITADPALTQPAAPG